MPDDYELPQFNSYRAPRASSRSDTINSYYNIPTGSSLNAQQASPHIPQPSHYQHAAPSPSSFARTASTSGMTTTTSSTGFPNHHQYVTPMSSMPTAQDMSLDQYYQYAANIKMVQQTVQLIDGKYVLEYPVPEKLLENAAYKGSDEFNKLRYTAVTCDPDEYVHRGYSLRQADLHRQTELFIVCTMYNEDEELFARTMSGIFKNIQTFAEKNHSGWDENSWQRIVVCIVSDGRQKINKRTLLALQALGVYQEGLAKSSINGEPVQAHVYEYTTQVHVNSKLEFSPGKPGAYPVQLLFCLKEANKKKLNSHRWYFNAFAKVLNPNVCVLLDVGTRPDRQAIYHLWRAFDDNENVAGACGEIKAMTGRMGRQLLNPLVASQNFEYKISNILDKPLESVFGYITVLPGAFSAYRYKALTNTAPNIGPLASYFKGETHESDPNAGIFERNMYLAEDRILCFELVAKRKSNWVLKYVKAATAETDVPSGIAEFMSQRRRWLNGSFFALMYALTHGYRLLMTNHGILRKLGFLLQYIYFAVNTFFSWFSLANFYLIFFFLGRQHLNETTFGGAGDELFAAVRLVYLFTMIGVFVSSLGNRPQGSVSFFLASMLLFMLIMVVMLYLSILTLLQSTSSMNLSDPVAFLATSAGRDTVIGLGSTFGLYWASSLLFLDPWHMLTSFVQYLLLLPSYINILQVYAFCNLQDVSWGTKGDDGSAPTLAAVKVHATTQGKVEVAVPRLEDRDTLYAKALATLRDTPPKETQKRNATTKQQDYYRTVRTRLVVAWVLCNGLAVVLLTSDQMAAVVARDDGSNLYLTFIFFSVAGLALVRFVGSVMYLLTNYLI